MANPLQWVTDFAATGIGGGRPVYQDGQRVGWWKDNRQLCSGRILIDTAFKGQLDPDRWVTKDFLWRDVPATKVCVDDRLRPAWLSDGQAKDVGADQLPNPQPQPGGVTPTPGAPGALDLKSMLPFAVATGIAVLGIVLLADDGRSYRRRRR